jgi:hypothetical protein
MVKLKDKIISKVDYLSKAKLARGSNVHDFLVAKTTVSGNNFHRTCCFVSNEAAGPAAAAAIKLKVDFKWTSTWN